MAGEETMKRALATLLLAASALCGAQTTNTFYVRQFPGGDVGTMTAHAQAACNANTSLLCYIVIDSTLASYAPGTLPTPCTQCVIQDLRVRPSSGGGSGLSGMTAGQVPIAATATTVTSSKALAGSGAAITTGPAASISLDCVEFIGTGGQLYDSGAPCASGGGGGGGGGGGSPTVQKNCLSVSCAGGSTYASGTTYTNLTSNAVLEEVKMSSALSGGGTGGDSEITSIIGGATGPADGVYNQCVGAAGITFLVAPGATFSATAASIDGCGGGTTTITSWLELTPVGGGGGTPAGTNGQPQFDASGSFGAQPNVIIAQAADTIASINATLCPSPTPCLYKVSIAQTMTIAANTSLGANVTLQFEGGSWTVNGSTFTLTIPTQPLYDPSVANFIQGTAALAINSALIPAPIEAFGAVGDCTNITCTTDDAPFINFGAASLTAGNLTCQAKGYKIGSALAFNVSGVGLVGPQSTAPPCYFVSTSATADGLDINLASTSTYLYGNVFSNFAIVSGIAKTAGVGIVENHCQACTVSATGVNDFPTDYDFIDTPANYQNKTGGIFNNAATRGAGYLGSANSTLTSEVGFQFDGTTYPFLSIRFNGNTATDIGAGVMTAFTAIGTVDDLMADRNESAHTKYGWYFSGATGKDVHINNSILDNCTVACIYTSGYSGMLSFDGGWAAAAGSGLAADFETSNGVSLTHTQILAASAGNAVESVLVHSSHNVSINDNTFQTCGSTCTVFQAATASSFTGNNVTTTYTALSLISSSYNTVGPNVFVNASSSQRIFFDSASGHNTGTWLNSFDNTSPAISDSGTDNQANGDATQSAANVVTLNTVNSNVGTYTNPTVTVNAKGLVTAAANGSPAYPAPTTVSVTAANELDVTGCITSSYTDYDVRLDSLTLVTASSTTLELQMSSNNGGSFDTASTYYYGDSYQQLYSASGTGSQANQSTVGGMLLSLSSSDTYNAGAIFNERLTFFSPMNTVANKAVKVAGQLYLSSTSIYNKDGALFYGSASAVNAFRIKAGSGATFTGSVTCQPLPQ